MSQWKDVPPLSIWGAPGVARLLGVQVSLYLIWTPDTCVMIQGWCLNTNMLTWLYSHPSCLGLLELWETKNMKKNGNGKGRGKDGHNEVCLGDFLFGWVYPLCPPKRSLVFFIALICKWHQLLKGRVYLLLECLLISWCTTNFKKHY